MRKARIENGVVREVLDVTPFPEFHPSLQWVECGPEVSEKFTYANGVFSSPPSPTQIEQNEKILQQISSLEEQSMIPRVVREFMLAQAVITAQAGGVDEPTLYAQNIGYRKLKDLDNQIFSLRQQLIL